MPGAGRGVVEFELLAQKAGWRIIGHRRGGRLNAMRDPHAEINEIVDRETRAWDTQDVELLLSVLHPDMVWPWPPDARR